uniref:rhodanese-like domain-containing protein n=1 Tax=Methylocella sp. TaxID=1978226 RepID=UPI003783E456
GATPETLTGARTIDAAGVAELIASGGPLLLLDVGPADRRPPSLAPDAVWMPAHRSIPGATWLPGAGLGTDDPAYAAAFRDRIATLTGGDLDRPIVVFCQPNCWGSWNAGKRLIGLGYRRVLWAPGGVDAWQAEHEVATVRADPVWARAAPQGAPQ